MAGLLRDLGPQPGTGAGAWTHLFRASLGGGDGGSIADGGTVDIGGVTFTVRGTAGAVTHEADGLRVQYSGGAGDGGLLGALPAALDTSKVYAVLAKVRWDTLPTAGINLWLAALARDAAGMKEYSGYGPYRVTTGTMQVTRRVHNTAGVYSNEVRNSSLLPKAHAVMMLYAPQPGEYLPFFGRLSLSDTDASLPAPSTFGTFGSNYLSYNGNTPLAAFNSFGLAYYLGGAQDMTLTEMGLYVRDL